MPVPLFLYYSSCYALAVACAVFAFVRQGLTAGGSVAPDGLAPSRDIRFALMVSFLALGATGMTFGFYQYHGQTPDRDLVVVSNVVSLVGLCGSVLAVPLFASAFAHRAATLHPQTLFAGLAVASLLCIPFIVGAIPASRATRALCSVFVGGCLLWAVIWSVLRLFKAVHTLGRQDSHVEARRWMFTLKATLILGLLLGPLSIACDFFLLPTTLWGVTPPKVLPLLAVGIGLSHLVGSLVGSMRLRRAVDRPGESPPVWTQARLTPRETEVARLLVSGYTYRAIAQRLGISAATVKTHILKTYDKTGAGNKLELLLFVDR